MVPSEGAHTCAEDPLLPLLALAAAAACAMVGTQEAMVLDCAAALANAVPAPFACAREYASACARVSTHTSAVNR